MNPIELGKAIADVGMPVITAVILILVVGLIWYLIQRQTKREDKQDTERTKRQNQHDEEQKEDREYFRNLLTNDVKDLHKDNLKNAELNNQGIILIKDMNKNLKYHNGNSQKAWGKTVKILGIISDKMNGGSPASVAIKKELEWYKERGIVDRRKVDEKVKVERRK